MRSAKSRLRSTSNERGQSAVLSALCLFVMVVFVALATNSGILVNDRLRMQGTADLTAYAGAFEQARTMNHITDINGGIYGYVQQVRGVLNYGPQYMNTTPPDGAGVFYWRQPPCSCLDYSPAAQAYIQTAQGVINAQAAAVLAVNRKGQVSSRAAATFTAGANFLKMAVGPRHLDFFQTNNASPTSQPDLVDLVRVNETRVGYNYLRSCKCCDGCCLYPSVHVETVSSWYYKDPDQGLIYFPAMVKGVPWKNFIDLNNAAGGYFGADADTGPSTDMLYGYAAAKPYDGMIGTSNPDNGSETEVPQQPVYPPSTAYEDYFSSTYRARISGIHEDMGTRDWSTSMAELIEGDRSEPQFRDKTEYFTH